MPLTMIDYMDSELGGMGRLEMYFVLISVGLLILMANMLVIRVDRKFIFFSIKMLG